MPIEIILLILSVIFYFVSFIMMFRSNRTANILIFLGIIFHFSLLVVNTVKTGYAPLTNIFETMLFFPFLLSLRLVFWKKQIPKLFRLIIVFLLAIINLSIVLVIYPVNTSRDLMPTLKSFWIYLHVPAYFIGYVSVLICFLYAIVIFLKKQQNTELLFEKMDQEVKISFYFLNIGLVTGAFWAYYSWGNYWSWDPKETWSLINILIFSLYFLAKPEQKRLKLIIVFCSFITILFTYFGVTYFLSGMHSYK